MPVRAGSLNKPATLEVKTYVKDSIGGHSETFETLVDPYWVKIKPVRGTEIFQVAQRFSSVTHILEGRYQDGLSAKTNRIKYGNRIFRIEAILNPDERNETVEFMCEESPATPEAQS